MNFSFRFLLPVLGVCLAGLALPALAQPAPLFVLNSLDASVSVIDPVKWTEIKRIPTGKQPHHIYLTPDEKSVIVANALSDSLTFIDPKTAQVQREVRGILDPYHLRFSPDMKWFVTAANRLNHIDIYRWDGADITLVKRIATGKTPSHLWIDSKSTTVYATMQDSDELIAIDLSTQTVKWRTPTGLTPADVFGTADDKFMLVGLTGSDGVEVYDVSGKQPQRTRVIKTGAGAHAFRAFGDGRHVLVTPGERLDIEVEDAAFVAVEVTIEGQGRERRLGFRLNTDDYVIAGPANALRVDTADDGTPRPYLQVRAGLEALVARPVFYELVELALADGGDPVGLWSDGVFFALGSPVA